MCNVQCWIWMKKVKRDEEMRLYLRGLGTVVDGDLFGDRREVTLRLGLARETGGLGGAGLLFASHVDYFGETGSL